MKAEALSLSCPTPLGRHVTVQMAHGGGGRLMRELIERLFLPTFGSPAAAERHDSAAVTLGDQRIAFTTDSYVVRPLFFPGGDIGKLAVYGTVNDLAMSGAKPVYLSAGFILEEGLPFETLTKIVRSMADAASDCDVELVTGDTKVVDKGKGDGVFINTAGIGLIPSGVQIRPSRVLPGDAIILSGDVGRHGVAILSVREGLEFDTAIESDCASLSSLVQTILATGTDVHCLRDLTRGGLASALNEIASDAGVDLEIDEAAIPVQPSVAGACEILGLDPLYVANEGRLVAFVPRECADRVLTAMHRDTVSREAAVIGRVTATGLGHVVARGPFGPARLLDLLSGEQLPRIC